VEGEARDVPDFPATAAIDVRSMRNERVDFTVDGPERSLVRIARTNDGDWKATIDGQRASVRTIDLSLVGIVVPAGRHDVVVSYEDPMLRIGIAISATMALLLLAATVIGRSAALRYIQKD
jgi:uncharacterized membrane protein YfhO